MATATEEEHARDVPHPLLISCEVVPRTFSGEDTVWIGFMDIVPVIGAVREAVELVLALYEGNEAVIKEKEKAVENLVKESLIKDVNKLTLSDKPAAAADEFSGLRNVREVRKEMIIEYVMKGSKKGIKPLTAAEQKAREKKVEAIKEEMLRKIRIIKPKFSQELEEQLERSKKGEHVFNNDILKFHSKVLTDFIQRYSIDKLRGYNQQAVNGLGRHTLTPKTAKEIQTEMVVHFGEDELYVNANGVMYGVYCSVLHEAMLAVLRHINPGDVTKEKKQWVNFVIYHMNKEEIYVDELAKVRWIANNATRRTRFDNVRQEVVHMYNTDRGVDWCIRILREVAPLFEHRQ